MSVAVPIDHKGRRRLGDFDDSQRIRPGFILPSAAFTIQRRQVAYYRRVDSPPRVGDVVYGEVHRSGFHDSLENKSGRIHKILVGSRAVFVYGNRYAPDAYEGHVPDEQLLTVDLLARSGVVGVVDLKQSSLADPTRIKILGQVFDSDGQPLNTRDHVNIRPKSVEKKPRRSPMTLVVGTSMNAGKSQAAAAICWGLTAMGYSVRASKLTGTASLKDILHMNDAGAAIYNDFTHLGWPSTYELSLDELLEIFDVLDLKYANNHRNHWIVELADGILQRETAALLSSPRFQDRIHRLVFCARDAFGCLGGIDLLEERFGLRPHGLSGVISSSPLHLRELADYSDIPVFDSLDVELESISRLVL